MKKAATERSRKGISGSGRSLTGKKHRGSGKHNRKSSKKELHVRAA